MSNRWIEVEGRAVPADSQGMTLEEWGAWYENADRRVARDHIPPWDVSTVFLGLDHSWLPNRPPMIYETMIFHEYTHRDEGCWRYSTREAAECGHREICEALRNGASIEAVRELEIPAH